MSDDTKPADDDEPTPYWVTGAGSRAVEIVVFAASPRTPMIQLAITDGITGRQRTILLHPGQALDVADGLTAGADALRTGKLPPVRPSRWVLVAEHRARMASTEEEPAERHEPAPPRRAGTPRGRVAP